jgi:hypothetical protein
MSGEASAACADDAGIVNQVDEVHGRDRIGQGRARRLG